MTFQNSSDINKESLPQWDAEYIVLSDYFFKTVEKGSLLDFFNLSIWRPYVVRLVSTVQSEIPNDVREKKIWWNKQSFFNISTFLEICLPL